MRISQPHPAPASGLFGSTWRLARDPAKTPSAEQFEARMVANERLATEQAPERPDGLDFVA